jgi:Glycosyl transferase family 2
VTDQTEPRTTVVIPVWDHYVALRFEEALESIASQDVPVAVVVVDNASHVPLPRLNGVTVIRTAERVPLGNARNLGLEHVHTEAVIFADADDLMLPGAVKHLQQGLDDDPRLIAFAMAFVDAETGQRHRWPRPWIAELVRFPTILAVMNAVWALYPITGPVLIRTAFAREVGGHAEIDNGDARCLGAALLFRGRVGWTEQPGCVYHQRPGSNLDRFSGVGSILESTRAVRERLRSDFGGPTWLRGALPLIAAAQWAAVGGHLLVVLGRRRARRP